MKLILIVALLFLEITNTYSNEFWKKDYAKVDSLARTIKATSSIEELALQLTSGYSSEWEKYRSIFTWVSNNISYDLGALKNAKLRETDPIEVIKNGKAVCAGYSSLFSKLCEIAKLECVTIIGWGRLRGNIGKPLNSEPNHAWNAIKIANHWYLCDVTWGAGSTSEDYKNFTFDFKDFYFCTPPGLFSYNHFPQDKKWLLGANISEKKFTDRPHYYNEAIRQDIKDLRPDYGVINYKKNKVLSYKFIVTGEAERISIKPSDSKRSTEIDFSSRDGVIEFNYTMDVYSPFLYIYLNSKPFLVYKMKKS